MCFHPGCCRYVDQLEGVDPQQTAIQVVVQADTEAQRAQRESEALEASKGSRRVAGPHGLCDSVEREGGRCGFARIWREEAPIAWPA